MNQYSMVAFIVLVVMLASVLRSYFKYRGERAHGPSPVEEAETLRLREEMKLLKDRMAVLERITVEKENSLATEIESLRDRSPVPSRRSGGSDAE